MATTYLPLQLAHAHLPAPPSIPLAIPELRIPSDRPYPQDAEAYSAPLHPGHAVSVVRDASTGILARTIRNGYVLELRTLDPLIAKNRSRDAPGSEVIRISFPDRLLSLTDGCISISRQERKLFILVVTEATVVYRLSFPLGGFRLGVSDRFTFSTKDGDWCEEYEVPEEVLSACGGIGAWIALDDGLVVLGGNDGGIVRLSRSGKGESVYWTAAHYRPSTKFRLPSLFSRSQLDEQVVSFVQYSSDNSAPLLYALSRDRKLRTWHVQTGTCLKTLDVRSSDSTDLVPYNDTTPPRATSSTSNMLGASVPCLRVLRHPSSSSRYTHLLVVFSPTVGSSTSTGSFIVYRASDSGSGANDLVYAGIRRCSSSSIGADLRGFEILPPHKGTSGNTGWHLQAVWEGRNGALVEAVTMDDIFQFTTYLNHPSSFLLTEWQEVASNKDVNHCDAAYFDELLSAEAPDPTNLKNTTDIASTFIDHLFHPGRFSAVTLTTALDEYITSLPHHRLASIVSAANGLATLHSRFAAIVGCHLTLEADSQTGAPLIETYRKDLKLDWLGVWARVRDLDKQARWAVTTAIINDQLFIFNREGVSTTVQQDVAGMIRRFVQDAEAGADFRALPENSLALYPGLANSKARSSVVAVIAAGSHLASILSSQSTEQGSNALIDLEVGLKSMFAGGIHQPFETLAGDIWGDSVEPYLADEDRTSMRRLLSECLDISQAIDHCRNTLAPVASESSGNPSSDLAFSSFGNALITSSISSTIADRYLDARDCLLVALSYSSESPEILEESEQGERLVDLLAQVFAQFHRCQVLKWITEQGAEEPIERSRSRRSAKRKAGADEESISDSLDVLRVGDNDGSTDGFDASYSLVTTLLDGRRRQQASLEGVDVISLAAASFISTSGLVNNDAGVDPNRLDFEFTFAVLSAGLPQTAGRLADLYPTSAGMAYIRGRAALDAGAIGEAVRCFEQAANGVKSGALSSVSSRISGIDGRSEYYHSIANLFSGYSHDAPVVHFGQMAIQSWPPSSTSPKSLWTSIFLAYIGLAQYEEAFALLMKTPFLDLQRDFLGQLVSVMCEANEVGRLNQLGFAGMQKEVEGLLSYKARNSDPLRFPNYYKVLHSWYISRGDYRSAGDIMFQQGRRFGSSSTSKVSAFELAAMQARSYLAAINALSLVDKRNAWISVPGDSTVAVRGTKRKRLTSYIPEEHFSKDKRPIDIMTLADIEFEYTLVLARLRLAGHIQDLHDHGVSLSSEEAIGMLVQRNMFDQALSAAASMQVDMTDIFTTIASRCVQLAHNDEYRSDSSISSWLHSSPLISRLRGSPAALALRYLHTALAQHDSASTNYAYRRAVGNTFFELNRDKNKGWQMPAWLIEWEMDRDPETWVSTAIKWGWVEEALDWTSEILRRAIPPELLSAKPDTADIPYNVIDRVLAAAGEGDEKDDPRVQTKAKALQEAVTRRIEGLKRIERR